MNDGTSYLWLLVSVSGLFGLAWHFRKKINPSAMVGGTPNLMQHAVDLTQQAKNKKLDPVIGRQEEIELVIQILARRTKNNPVLVGKAGVGKTAIVEGLAQAIVNNKVPKSLRGKRVLSLDLAGIVAGTKYRGEFEERLKHIADEIVAAKRNIILFVDEVHTLAQAGEADGGIDASDILKPALARGELQLVGATTFLEYQKFIKPDPTLDRRFESVLVDEPSAAEVLQILQGIKNKYEEHHGVKISLAALKETITAAKQFKDRSYPDKAIDLMDEAAAKVSLEITTGRAKPEVTIADVKEVTKEWATRIKAGLS